MLKNKITLLFLCFSLLISSAFASVDKMSEEYLESHKHISLLNPFAEFIVKKEIKNQLKKQLGADFNVKFKGSTLSSMKRGIFKYLEIEGKEVIIEEIFVPYLNLKTLSTYNWIDYTSKPIKFKSDVTFQYNIELSESSINTALKNKAYQKTINNINRLAYPLFTIRCMNVKVKDDKIHFVIKYNFPVLPSNKDKLFIVSSNLIVENGKIKAKDVYIDKSYGNIPLDKVANLINMLDPLSFTLDLLENNECETKIENIKIENNLIYIDGKVFIKGVK